MHKTIGSTDLRKMIISGSRTLDINRAKVDALNVFPVPDGDTGTNMSLTLQSCVREVSACSSNNIADVCDAIAKGALKGARGNSGVITSQILRGICSVFKEGKPIDCKIFAKAFESGAKVAYGAVSIPKEGTILTVIRMMGEYAIKNYGKFKDIDLFLDEIIKEGDRALALTPELLPVLKKAGVVDSGGVGLMTIIRGWKAALAGEEISEEEVEGTAQAQKSEEDVFGDNSDIINLDLGEIEFAYCTEFFVINLKKSTTLADIERLKEKLMRIGDSVICIGDLDFVKVHVHTNTPGRALTYALELGELDRIKIENMLEENRQVRAKMESEKKEMGMVSVCAGKGISNIFKDLFVDKVIEGGQTMNPSANDIADAVQRVNASSVFVFPNNKNIILAAEQAKALVTNRTIHVIPTKNVPQGFAAALAFDPEATPAENKANMMGALDNVKVGQVTHAVRTTTVGRFHINEGDIIGLDDKKILAKGTNVEDAVISLLGKMKESSHEVITLYYGEEITEEQAEAMKDKIADLYPDCDVDVHCGGQPVYYYIISLE
ncbi:MAG: DAK2 domain-containing protein [Clostridia bacterium]|nr:DAK2 domain-containing protein [Clostridia bacterium]